MQPFQTLAIASILFASCIPHADAQPAAPRMESIPLRYDAALTAKGFPSPVVHVTIAGHDALFLIDTGAGVHTFAAWFVAQSGVPTRPSAAMLRGSTGIDSQVRVISDVVATLDDGAALRVREGAVVDLPPIFAENRIGGLLSPQLLAATGEAAVLDLRAPSLRFEPFAAAAARLAAGPAPDANARVCQNPDSIFVNRVFGVPVRVVGVDTTLLIDSGATRTVVTPESAVAHAIGSRSVAGGRTEGVGGAAQTDRRVAGVGLARGGASTTLDLTIGGSSQACGPDGLLGMDALRACVAVLGEADARLFCAPPPAR